MLENDARDLELLHRLAQPERFEERSPTTSQCPDDSVPLVRLQQLVHPSRVNSEPRPVSDRCLRAQELVIAGQRRHASASITACPSIVATGAETALPIILTRSSFDSSLIRPRLSRRRAVSR